MRCKGCEWEDYDYQEGYTICKLFGDDDNYIYENKKGELGCKYNRKSLQRFVKMHERDEQEIVRQMGDFVKFCEEYEKEADKVIAEKDAEIHRLHRCVIRMTRQWLSAIDDMYSRLDDVHGLDDQDVMDWDKVTELHENLNKVLEKWK